MASKIKLLMSGWNRKLEGLQSNTEETLHSLEFATSQEAWEKLNEAFLRLDPVLFDKGATANSGVAVAYNVFIKIRKAWVDPDFDYGRCFNYKETKWTSLLNNYIDFNKLDLLRSKLRFLKSKYNQNYNVTYMFNNHHDNGKQCLIAATFSKRFGGGHPSYYNGSSSLRNNQEVNIRLPINSTDGRIRVWAGPVSTNQPICDSNVWECRDTLNVLSL